MSGSCDQRLSPSASPGSEAAVADDFYDVLGRTARRYMGAEAEERMMGSTLPGVVIRIEPSVIRGWDYVDEA